MPNPVGIFTVHRIIVPHFISVNPILGIYAFRGIRYRQYGQNNA